MKLNLGSCQRDFPGFISVDICEPADQIVDLAGPWPWPDSSVSEVLAYDVLEHIGDCSHVALGWVCNECSALRAILQGFNGESMRAFKAKVHVMNELWRILEPGGRATFQIPHATLGDGGYCDPTHSSYWTTSDFEYYTPGVAERERFRSSPYYGIEADFKVLNLDASGHIPMQKYARKYGGSVYEMHIILEAVKP